MKLFFLICALLGSSLAQDYLYESIIAEEHWESFKVEYEKNYQDYDEELYRRQIFLENKKLIDQHNLRYESGEETYKMGVNAYTDLLDEEFRNRMLSGLYDTNYTNYTKDIDFVYSPSQNVQIPPSVDWVQKRGVTPIKNQFSCGSCWSFATIAVLETHNFIKTGQLVSLSEQNLLDCTSIPPYNNHGCNGGWPGFALNYVRDNQGVDTERSYPYENAQGQCRFNKNYVGARIKGVSMVERGNEKALAATVANFGPAAVVIDATNIRHYQSGVYSDRNCGYQPNHAVTAVGYGYDERQQAYWLIKNSWGRNWGNGGYMKMARNMNNLCQIASFAVFAY